jgi:hypothetical protein
MLLAGRRPGTDLDDGLGQQHSFRNIGHEVIDNLTHDWR